jgi:hypothetical protein
MFSLFCFLLAILALPFKSKSRLEAENAALRHQLVVLRRKMRGRVRLTNSDRMFFIQLYRWFPSVLKVITIIRIRAKNRHLPVICSFSANRFEPSFAVIFDSGSLKLQVNRCKCKSGRQEKAGRI